MACSFRLHLHCRRLVGLVRECRERHARRHDEAPRKRRYRDDPAFITSVIWRTACALHSALAADETGVVLAMRSMAWTVEWNSSLRLKHRMDSARSAYVTTSAARRPNHWWSGFAIAAGAADLHRSSSTARSTSSYQLILLHLPSASRTTKSGLARQSSLHSIYKVPSSCVAGLAET